MTETVTDIIVARSRQSEGLQAMVLWSAAGHVLLMAALLLSGGRVIEDAALINTWETDARGQFRYAVEEALDPDDAAVDPLAHL